MYEHIENAVKKYRRSKIKAEMGNELIEMVDQIFILFHQENIQLFYDNMMDFSYWDLKMILGFPDNPAIPKSENYESSDDHSDETSDEE